MPCKAHGCLIAGQQGGERLWMRLPGQEKMAINDATGQG